MPDTVWVTVPDPPPPLKLLVEVLLPLVFGPGADLLWFRLFG